MCMEKINTLGVSNPDYAVYSGWNWKPPGQLLEGFGTLINREFTMITW